MKTIKICKFSPLADQIAEGIIIEITEDIPNFDTLEESGEFFEKQAELLANALLDNLPQGVTYQFLIKYMQKFSNMHLWHYRGKTGT